MSDTKYLVLFLKGRRVPLDAAEQIAGYAAGRTVLVTEERAEIEKILDKIEIAAGDFPQELIPRAPGLKWFQQWYAGADWLQRYPDAQKHPFTLTNASGIHGPQMAEHLFGLLIAWYRKFPEVFEAQKRHEWQRSILHKAGLLYEKSLLIAGFGSVGGHIARIASAFGMHITGVRRSPPPHDLPPGLEKIVSQECLETALGEADVVVNILPCTQETHHIFNGKTFEKMKQTALFANIGRGPTVDETALAQAVRSGRIAGAVLDVTETEPLPPESPLWDIPGIIITPHYSGSHPQYDEIVFHLFLDNLKRYTSGSELRNIVNKTLGY
ncbi:MAG: D-2-hydroxyacid dehydrogenase [Spirochaetales bacterium]|jgi:phosphoglycerate dehydrogenase-like enzyme|nr:D-2-hydroxyacid dehydrogenase [Spirochaetales bacterium]